MKKFHNFNLPNLSSEKIVSSYVNYFSESDLISFGFEANQILPLNYHFNLGQLISEGEKFLEYLIGYLYKYSIEESTLSLFSPAMLLSEELKDLLKNLKKTDSHESWIAVKFTELDASVSISLEEKFLYLYFPQ